MKNYILTFILVWGISSCGPTETQENDLRNLITEWKNTSAKAVSLSQEIGDKYYLFQAKKNENDQSEVLAISLNGEKTNCKVELEKIKSNIDQFIESWQEKSQQVDDLTNSMSIGKWTAQDQEALESLDLEVKERDVQLEQWLNDLEKLNDLCNISADNIVITEVNN